jgi:GxxExxY protein
MRPLRKVTLDELNKFSGEVVDAAMEVHSALGPGLLESVYEQCLAQELLSRNLNVDRQVLLPVTYKNQQLDAGFRIDLVVEDCLIVGLKAVDEILPIHEAQLMTYLKLSGCKVGLLLNFNVISMKKGIKRIIL